MKRCNGLLLGLILALASGGAAADTYIRGGDNDPRVRTSEFLASNGRYLSASAMLERIEKDAPRQPLGQAYYRELAGDTLSFGLPQRAEAIYRQQVADAKDIPTQSKARLQLADFYYQRGYFQQATAELALARAQLPREMQMEWDDLQSRVLLAQGRYGEAADILTQADSGEMSNYMRYNLGVALINDGRVGQGVNMLDRVGRLTPFDSEALALRDKANLTLGYHFLRTRQGGTAIPIFGRVRTVGPYSNRALLGLGWAYLAPRGDRQGKTEVGDETPDQTAFTSFATIGVLLRPGYIDSDSVYRRAKLAPFHLSGKYADDEAQLKQALVPWVELVGRDQIDPSVQEGLLAIPYVLDRLGAHTQAQQYYERAIDALEETRKRLTAAEQDIRSGRMVHTMVSNYDPGAESGWRWKLRSLPDAPETFYLQSLIAGNKFQEALKNYRDLIILQSDLITWKARLGELQQSYQVRSSGAAATAASTAAAVPSLKAAVPGYLPDASAAPQLQMEEHLNAYTGKGSADAPDAESPVALQLAQSPAADKFVGPYERMQALRARIDALAPRLSDSENIQAKLLQDIALDELLHMKEMNEKYLVEARFALARIYDSQLRGPDSGSNNENHQ
jgi:tetratricopeptide (TPR) repeat protein